VGAPIRVLLVEDSEAFRGTIAFLLRRIDGVEVVGEVAEGAAAAAACAASDAEVAVLDLRLPDVSGPAVAAEIRERCPRVAVVFLSAFSGPAEREAARIARVRLVRKDEGVDALVAAIREARGEQAWS
jgi:DNA-binding NarL/FixJ family response regulator